MMLLAVALLAFVGTHFAMSHPLRSPMIGALGKKGFQLAYLLVSFGTLGWAAHAFGEAPYGQPLWTAGEALWMVSTVIMFAASVLLAGSFVGNPALPAPGAEALAAKPARGVFTITRHPMMWSIALWGLAHIIVSPRPAVILLCAAMAFLALGGAAGQDVKKRALMGDAWRDWSSRTSYWPFAKGAGWPGTVALLGGTILWLAATWAHPLMGAPHAGVWRWLS
jgi:uncharacterized membrane protein